MYSTLYMLLGKNTKYVFRLFCSQAKLDNQLEPQLRDEDSDTKFGHFMLSVYDKQIKMITLEFCYSMFYTPSNMHHQRVQSVTFYAKKLVSCSCNLYGC